jgi:hypothetical protein
VLQSVSSNFVFLIIHNTFMSSEYFVCIMFIVIFSWQYVACYLINVLVYLCIYIYIYIYIYTYNVYVFFVVF